ncbi:tetrapyrrole biosynthesis, uroporphyrinogen III synthase [Collybia nuda]|uniref:Tetrapyrrole biosynthesis, uroporphyrinogen III synthase n=1 Tax=Collybia nuda TaxID=64659 RepID=A0A9P5XVX6_9AGAR|nr:tetrapyrrole biosynthesis, uroporphyrinogen III synthase [Collybia nuda]
MSNVLLLREPSSITGDRYEIAFNMAGYHAISVPVLETVFVNLPGLKSIVKEGPTVERFDGVIITSGRACEAWKTVVHDLVKLPPNPEGLSRDGWSTIPFFVVGHGTAAALSEVRKTYGSTMFTPEILRGEPSGTGEKLAQFILDGPHEKPKKLLYLTGDKNRDTVPKILEGAGVELWPLKVYETQGSTSFERDLAKVMESAPTASMRWWVVHFAPSAAGFVTPVLRKYFKLPSSDRGKDAENPLPTPRTAAIGPVTTSFMRDELNISVDVTALNPTPQDLLAAIIANEQDFRN